jgi:hypothetical protein
MTIIYERTVLSIAVVMEQWAGGACTPQVIVI